MKTKTIKSLKKELLVIEDSAAIDFYEINPRMLAFNMLDGSIKIFKGNFTFLGKPDEIKEDDLEGLFKEYKDGYFSFNKSLIKYNTKIRAFNKLIESEIYWENPELKLSDFEYFLPSINEGVKLQKKFNEAQEKTFDKKRTLIFAKL